jgi:hypothetical protein
MIVFDLECREGGHRFECWFRSSDDFGRQQTDGLLCCPECGSSEVIKAPMAPAVGRKGNQQSEAAPSVPAPSLPAPIEPQRLTMSKGKLPPEAMQMMRALARMQSEALKQSRWVGEDFADSARAMHYGEREVESIHGEATLEEAQELLEEGIEVAPLPFPVAPPADAN